MLTRPLSRVWRALLLVRRCAPWPRTATGGPSLALLGAASARCIKVMRKLLGASTAGVDQRSAHWKLQPPPLQQRQPLLQQPHSEEELTFELLQMLLWQLYLCPRKSIVCFRARGIGKTHCDFSQITSNAQDSWNKANFVSATFFEHLDGLTYAMLTSCSVFADTKGPNS